MNLFSPFYFLKFHNSNDITAFKKIFCLKTVLSKTEFIALSQQERYARAHLKTDAFTAIENVVLNADPFLLQIARDRDVTVL